MEWTELERRARAWCEQDPDPAARAELEALLARGPAAAAELSDRFQGPLAFGTAGLRGLIGAGQTRMNRAVVIRTTAGLAAALATTPGAELRRRGVAIGYDGRRLSREMAEDAAGVLAAAGVRVHLSEGTCPTPLLAYAVRHLDTAAGIMVTASHNPPDYNGYKVYAGNGAQIVPPFDAAVAAEIDRVGGAASVPRLSLAEAEQAGRLTWFGAELDRAYLDGLRGESLLQGGARDFPVVTTALHGVGGRLLLQALAEAGFSRVFPVAEQQEPDGRFPTVAFPNPEEPGALDLAFALARRHGAALVLANDPDADRLAAALPDGAGGYRQLTGNEIGVLLGHHALTRARPGARPLVLTTIVSSPLLGRIAAGLGARYDETLTGFKWIANRALELEGREGVRFAFGYEEALGYTLGHLVRDKDGIGAALALAELVADLRTRGETLLDRLEQIQREFGLYVSGQITATLPGSEGAARIKAVMEALRSDPPRELAGLEVLSVSDYGRAERRDRSGGVTRLELPTSNVLALELSGGTRVMARPSGTEPKIKVYLDVQETVAKGEPFPAARARAEARLEQLKQALSARLGL